MDIDDKRGPGRPRRGDRPPVPWDELEKAYVTGEVVRQLPDGSFQRRYPSIRDLAAKFSVGRSLVGYLSRRHNWPGQRLRFRDGVRTEIQQIAARARAVSTEDTVASWTRTSRSSAPLSRAATSAPTPSPTSTPPCASRSSSSAAPTAARSFTAA